MSLHSKSESLYAQAQQLIPGGVNSPVRAFTGVGGVPLFIERADGAYLFDADGKAYIDYVGSWGPMVLGHNHPAIRDAVIEAAQRGLSFGAPTEMEVKMAQLVTELVPSMEMVRMVSSGTEATMSAIRLARGYTGRDSIIKFEGCYHGHSDSLLVKAGSGALTFGVPNSPGVPAAFAKHTLTCTYNDLDSVRAAFEQYPSEIACIIVEPVAGNMNCVPPAPGFLEGLREACDEHGVVLIFDEVMTGFRVALGGAQAYYGVTPDLSTFGKIIGGGMPVGAFGGRREVMDALARPGLPGRHALGQPAGHGGGLRLPDRSVAGWRAPDADRTDRDAGRWPAARGAGREYSIGGQQRRRHVRPVLHRRAGGHLLPGRDAVRRRTLQALLPPDAGRGGVSRAVRLRSGFHVRGAQQGRHPAHHRRRASLLRQAVIPAGWPKRNGRRGARFVFHGGLQQRAVNGQQRHHHHDDHRHLARQRHRRPRRLHRVHMRIARQRELRQPRQHLIRRRMPIAE